MKVCFVTANYPPEAMGGTEQVVVALAREMTRRDATDQPVSVSILSGSDVLLTGADLCEQVHEQIPVTRVFRKPEDYDRHGFVRPRILALVRAHLQQLQPDVVHVHSFAGLSLGVAAICRELQIPLVVTFHDLWVTCARYFRLPAGGVTCPLGGDREPCVVCVNDALSLDAAVVRDALLQRDLLMQQELQLADICTAPSQTAANFVRDGLPHAGAIEVLPHGLLLDVPREHAAALPQPGEALRIGTYGGLVAEKGIEELVRACVALVQSGLACELHLSGPWHDPAFAAQMRELARTAGLPLVERGRYAPEDRHPARDLHLAVFPSKCQETYGLVVDEALAHRVPTVVSDCGALAERALTPGVVVTALDLLPNVLRELVASPARLSALRDAIPAQLPAIRTSAQRHLELYRTLR